MLLTFDLDGVVMKNPFSTGVFPEVTYRISQETGLARQDIMKSVIAEARDRMGLGKMVDAYNWDEIIALVASRLGFTGHIDVAALVRQFCTPEHIYAYPEVHETLEYLSTTEHPLVVLTNGFRKYQLPVLEALGVAEFFDEIYTPEVNGIAKPEPGFFLEPQERYPGPHIHIGDTIIHDIWGANEVGITTVWVYHDLPEAVASLPIKERIGHAMMKKLVEDGIARDLNAAAYPRVTVQNSMPDYVIKSFGELTGVLDL
ncbi:MAG: HAD family hydrolase [Limnochordia bacterium]|jgi:FMN phosphatase YigB (HAD superfamily)|nr:HAD family hydrolase [Limnochordia bacterium]